MSARRRGLLRLSVLLVAVAGVVVLVVRSQRGSGGGEQGGMPKVTDSTPAKPMSVRLVARTSPQYLPAPISGEAAVASRNGVLSIGGLDSNTVSTSSVVELRPPDGKARAAGSLVEPLHDAAAAAIAGKTLVFGGGSASTIDSVESLARRGTSSIVGHLPVPRSDLSAATVGGRAYVLGGYDGSVPVGDVLQTGDGRSFKRIASLPTPVRYAAVVPKGHVIYAFGGEIASGQDSDVIQAVDVSTHSARVIGHLARATSHASAVALGRRIYVLGGRSGATATDRILAFDPASKRISVAGRLPYPVMNAAATTAGGVGFLIGGLGAAGTALDAVATIRLVPG